MKSDTPLDYAVFQLSPKHTRCELLVSSAGTTEKLASGSVKPFVTHLKVAEEQVARAVQSIKLEVERRRNDETWFTKGTLERFVRFVSTPEVLELVNTFDAEMSQLEAARRIYSQGTGDQPSSTLGGDGAGAAAVAAADATKKELLRAIDVRLVAVRQDLTTACARAAAAGFTPDAVSELQLFAERFGAGRLNEACSKFITLCERRPDLINPWRAGVEDRAVRSSYGSDMSIDEDEPTEEQPSGSHQPHDNRQSHDSTGREVPDATRQKHLEQVKPSTCQQPKPAFVTFPIRRSRESSVDKDDSRETNKAAEEEKKEEGVDLPAESPQISQPPVRRLSVQDRISLFENKQKESSGSGGKPVAVVGKSAELRRLSSDVSSAAASSAVAEKAVLRRWSGASDMSIDLSGEKKEIESPLCTPLSSSVSQTKSEDKTGLNDTLKSESKTAITKEQGDSQTWVGVTSSKEELVGTNSRTQLTVSSGRPEDISGSNKLNSNLVRAESDNWKDQTRGKTQSRPSSGSAEENSLKDSAASQTQFRSLSGGRVEQYGLTDQWNFRGSLGGDQRVGGKEQVASDIQIAGLKDGAAQQTQSGAFNIRSAESYQLPGADFLNREEDVKLRDQFSQSLYRTPVRTTVDSGQLEVSALKTWEVSSSMSKGTKGDQMVSQPHWKFFGEVEEVGKKHSETQFGSSAAKLEASGLPKMKSQKQFSAPDQIKKSEGRTDDRNSDYGTSKRLFSGKMVSEGQEAVSSIQVTPVQQVQRTRQSKGNQELNDELQLKASELEKLFAEHKLRVPGDQSNSARRTKPADAQVEPASSLPFKKPAAEIAPPLFPEKKSVAEPVGSSSNVAKLGANSLMKRADNREYSDDPSQNFTELGLSDDSKGKFYDRYMQKRDAKLREEWGSKRAEKEAKMKAMQDSLEQSKAEMTAKFSGSADRQDSVSSARRRADRLISFNTRPTMKREQLQFGLVQSEDDEELSELPDLSFGETSLGDSASRSNQNKKLLYNKNLSSSTPRTSVAPIVPRSAVKASNSTSGKRRMQSENPLTQSVPNFSDLRKENTKPSSGASKTTTRPQLRSSARSKSTSEDVPLVKEEKPRRSQSLRKSSASPAAFKVLPPLDSEGIGLSPLKFDKEQTEQSHHEKFIKNVESKPFLRKGNGIGPGSGSGIAKLKAATASETMNLDEESDDSDFEPEDSVDVVKDEEEEYFETMAAEHHDDMDNGKSRRSQESDKLVNSGSENGDVLSSFSQVGPSLVAELPASVPSVFHPVGSQQNSPGESPVSWISRMQHPFSYIHETSDVDASADSPMGSPASWNSHPLNQTETDAARMRKKWGSAQKPILVSNSSHNQSRKDVTKGFKRLLKFGRKTRGTESLVDWISATTSEGDDDTEDGRDPANRSSDDLRKSRMGFSQGHPSDDSFHESEFFSEQVQALHSSIPAPPANFKLREDHLSGSAMKAPRSFFSLSSFRSKGSDSKPR